MEIKNDDKIPFISIIIPAKNEENYIARCLEGVLALEYPQDKTEIIVVDNDSTDRTKMIVRQYGKVVLMDSMGTVGAVRNFGAKNARGEIVAFIDGDSIPHREWLQIACNHFKKDKGIGCIGFAVSEPDSGDSWVEKIWYKMSSSSKYKGGVCNAEWLSSFNLILKKDLFYQVGCFDEKLETCEDADLGYKLNKVCKLIFSDEIKVKHMGNAKTLKEFFFKELWRGKGNFKSFLQNKNKSKNFLSVFIPGGYLLLVLLLVVSLFLYVIDIKNVVVIYFTFIMLISTPFFLALIKQRCFNVIEAPKMTTLYFVYLCARGLALFRLKQRDSNL